MFCCKNAEATEYTVGNIENDEINESNKNDRIDSVDLNVYCLLIVCNMLIMRWDGVWGSPSRYN